MNKQRKLGTNGQVIIPKDARDLLGLAEGSTVIFEIADNYVILKKKLTPEQFIKKFTQTPSKLSQKINIKQILDHQIEDRI